MRTFKGNIRLLEESWESQREAGRYNPATQAHFRAGRKSHALTLNAGTSDRLAFFREGEYFIVLSSNWNLHYIGLQVYNTKECDCEEDIFLSGDQVDEMLGKDAFDLADITLAKRLFNYHCEVHC